MSYQKKSRDDRKAEVAGLIDRIKAGVKSVQTSEDWVNHLRASSRFHRYSFGNQMLIAIQRPGASYVAGFGKWQTMGRVVRKGEKAIRILAPAPFVRTETDDNGNETTRRGMYFKTASIFDYSQTDPLPDFKGKPFAPPAMEELSGDPDHAEDVFNRLVRHADTLQIPVALEILRPGLGGYYDLKARRIVVRADASPMMKAKTLAHELAHATLHPAIDDYHAHRGRYETEAESVAFCVMQVLGVDAGAFSFTYVAGWAADAKMVRESMEAIHKGTAAILDGVLGKAKDAESLEQAAAA